MRPASNASRMRPWLYLSSRSDYEDVSLSRTARRCLRRRDGLAASVWRSTWRLARTPLGSTICVEVLHPQCETRGPRWPAMSDSALPAP